MPSAQLPRPTGVSGAETTIAGIAIPSTDPVFLSVVALHIPLGLLAVVTGAIAMLSRKQRGRHPRFGTIYFWSIVALTISASILSLMRWSEDYHLFVLGVLALIAALLGRNARRRQRRGWPRWHVLGMGASYVLLLTAFYVDNGKQLPIWRDLPVWSYWLGPTMLGAPLIGWALLRHPVVRRARLSHASE